MISVAQCAAISQAFQNKPGKPGKPIMVGVASDGDNTISRGQAAFADIHFVGSDQPCET